MVTNKTLRAIYKAYNLALFDNQLPSIPIYVAELRKQGLRGFFSYSKNQKAKCILIDSKESELWPQILLHEMCHVYYTSVLKRKQKVDHPPGFLRLLRSKYKKLGFTLLPEEKL